MAIRLRTIKGRLIAICAARSIAKTGDIYLDDNAHHALAVKFDIDYASEYDYIPAYINDLAVELMEQEESNNLARTWWDKIYK